MFPKIWPILYFKIYCTFLKIHNFYSIFCNLLCVIHIRLVTITLWSIQFFIGIFIKHRLQRVRLLKLLVFWGIEIVQRSQWLIRIFKTIMFQKWVWKILIFFVIMPNWTFWKIVVWLTIDPFIPNRQIRCILGRNFVIWIRVLIIFTCFWIYLLIFFSFGQSVKLIKWSIRCLLLFIRMRCSSRRSDRDITLGCTIYVRWTLMVLSSLVSILFINRLMITSHLILIITTLWCLLCLGHFWVIL